jgi:adenosylcobinamide kinase/adenosylcobinamide-phosphate guanylyltransferase
MSEKDPTTSACLVSNPVRVEPVETHTPNNQAVIARGEFILGGQKSGKSRRAETLARDWLARAPSHRAVLVATALAGDDEMRERIARHQRDRAERVPGLLTVEEPMQLADAIKLHSRADTLVVVDCLTLWLTNWLMPMPMAPRSPDGTAQTGESSPDAMGNRPIAISHQERLAILLEAIGSAKGPLVLVGNEIGLGVIPMGPEVRAFVDALGRLNQDVAAGCQRVTLMVAGLPMNLKDAA